MLKSIQLFALFALSVPGSAATQQFDDSDVRDAVEQELMLDSAVPSNDVDVRVHSGVVTLAGEVDNLLANDRAVRIAETVKGVRAVVDRIEVDPAEDVTDAEARESVTAALLHDPAADSYEVNVAVADGHVVLSGLVDSWQERALSANIAKGVYGVTNLTNEIEVAFDMDRPDVEIQHEIEGALRWNALVDHGLVDVEVNGGTVKLSGTVGSAAEKREARTSAYVAGVESVESSDLDVMRWARDEDLRKDKYVDPTPERIQSAVADALEIDPRVNRDNVQLTAIGGLVTLRGVVQDLKAKRVAEMDARNVVGVHSVHNHLKVRPAEEREDDAIRQDVVAAMLRDPYVERFELDVEVEDGVVRLEGSVDSSFEKAQADDLASRVKGVTTVLNAVDVDDSRYVHEPYVDTWSVYTYPWYWRSNYFTLEDDLEIAREIRDELFWSPFVDSDEVTVVVRDGVATLTGTVDSSMERGAARDNAFEGGAVRVDNRLEIEAEGTTSS